MIITMMDGVDAHRQHFLERLFASLLAVTFVIVAARLYSRFFVTRNAMLDDYVALVAWVSVEFHFCHIASIHLVARDTNNVLQVFVSGQTSMDLTSTFIIFFSNSE